MTTDDIVTGPERDPLAANEERLGAIRANAAWIHSSNDRSDTGILAKSLADDIDLLLDALTQARGDAQAAESRYADLVAAYAELEAELADDESDAQAYRQMGY